MAIGLCSVAMPLAVRGTLTYYYMQDFIVNEIQVSEVSMYRQSLYLTEEHDFFYFLRIYQFEQKFQQNQNYETRVR